MEKVVRAFTSNNDSIGVTHNNDYEKMSGAYVHVINALQSDGWVIRKYKKTDSGYISDDWRYGIKGNLKIRIETDCLKEHSFNWNYGFKFRFFEDVTPCDNSSGGVYKHNRFKEMPYLLGLMSIKACKIIKESLIACGFEFDKDYSFIGLSPRILAKQKIHERITNCCHYKPELGRADWNCDSNRTSEDGLLIEHGQDVYFTKRGRLMKGVAYYDLNNRWTIAYGKYDVNYVSCGEIAINPNIKKGRKFHERYIDGRLQKELSKAVNSSEYLRAHQLKQIIDTVPRFRIWSIKHGGGWWCANGNGYTTNIINAGLFKKEEAEGLCNNDAELSMKAVA